MTSWHDYPGAILGWTERALIQWFGKHVGVGETWLDIGAHYGYTAVALSELVGPTGRVFAFEPAGPTCSSLAYTRALNRLGQLRIVPCGLGSPTDVELAGLPGDRGMLDATLSRPVDDPLQTFLVARLDWLWPRIADGSPRIEGLKIDVQGMEVDVLRGSAQLLREFRPQLVIEMHRGVDRSDVLAILRQSGYEAPGIPIDPLSEELTPQYLDNRSYWFDPRPS